MKRERFLFVVALIFCAAASRLVPHAPNFTPVAAMALFGGAQFSDKRAAFGVPLIALLLSDMIIGFYAGMWVTYVAFAVIVIMGMWLRTRQNWGNTLAMAVASAVVFFIITNCGAWYFEESLYPQTWAGLMEGYVAAIPFFQNTLVSDLFYTALLFGAVKLAERHYPAVRGQPI